MAMPPEPRHTPNLELVPVPVPDQLHPFPGLDKSMITLHFFAADCQTEMPRRETLACRKVSGPSAFHATGFEAG